MKLIVNGLSEDLKPDPDPSNLLSVIKQLGYQPKLIVVEFNGEIINSKRWAEQKVQDGDILEIVTIVGGG